GSSLPEAVCKTGFDIGFIDSSSPGWDGGGFCCSADAGPQLEPCGGAAAHRCAANDYCAYFEGQMCGRADASSYCKPRPTACGEVAAPVCGCDGTTYDNACSAHRAGVGVDSSAACPHPTTP
ncbi:MAG TPA: hypothetical protein VEQ59_03335, partial [Polyangiaceae bacterium]|nr:hypothetical protein [Polyangiaceae bacterium]